MKKWVPLAAVTVSGAALALAFPEPDVAPLAWVALSPFFYALGEVRARRGFGLGFLFGLAFFGVLLYWISIVGWVAWLILILLQALFVACFGAVSAAIGRRLPAAARVLVFAAAWVFFEFVRTQVPLGGFPWGQLAQSQHNVSWILESAAIAGSWGTAFLLAACNAFLAEGYRAFRDRRAGLAFACLGLASLAIAGPIPFTRDLNEEDRGAGLTVAIVQGNVPRDFAGTQLLKDFTIILNHSRLTKTLAGKGIDLVVWPESSVGIDLENNLDASTLVFEAARAVEAPMIVGANLDVDAERYRVMALQVSSAGKVVDRYQKTHLVPFGEYVPARSALDWIPMLDQVPRDAVTGEEKTIFDVAGTKVAPVISFEGDFGSLVRERVDAGGEMVVVATNTSTWEESWASAQHVAFSQVRAAENGVPVVHAALSGISAFIEPDGTVTKRTPLWTSTTAVQEVYPVGQPTLYARTGDWLPWICLALIVGLAAWAYVRRSEENGDNNEKGATSDG